MIKTIHFFASKVILVVMTMCLITTSVFFAFHAEEPTDLSPKIFCDATLEDDFVDDHVILILNNETSLQFHQYDADDFPEIDCIQVTDLTKYTGNRAK